MNVRSEWDKQIDPGDMCPRCMELLGGGIYTQPHAKLVPIEPAGASALSDETHFRCSVCGCYWIHESGSTGMGWIRPYAI